MNLTIIKDPSLYSSAFSVPIFAAVNTFADAFTAMRAGHIIQWTGDGPSEISFVGKLYLK